MKIYELHTAAFKDEDKEIVGYRYFTALSDAMKYLEKQVEPHATDIELYSATIDRLQTAKLPVNKLIVAVANEQGWVGSREHVKYFEYDYNTGERTEGKK